jgi:hypothetical protein
MGPELETTRVELRFTAHTSLMIQGGGPGYSTQGLSKSLIYNISLMAGQTRGYDLWTSELQVDIAPFRDNRQRARLETQGGAKLASSGNMRHRSRTARTARPWGNAEACQSAVIVRHLAHWALQDGSSPKAKALAQDILWRRSVESHGILFDQFT